MPSNRKRSQPVWGLSWPLTGLNMEKRVLQNCQNILNNIKQNNSILQEKIAPGSFNLSMCISVKGQCQTA